MCNAKYKHKIHPGQLGVFKHFRRELEKQCGIDPATARAWAVVAAADYAHAIRRGQTVRAASFVQAVNLQFYASQALLGMPAVRVRRYRASERADHA